MALGIALGTYLGSGLGVALGNIGVGIDVGTDLGVALGPTLLAARTRRRQDLLHRGSGHWRLAAGDPPAPPERRSPVLLHQRGPVHQKGDRAGGGWIGGSGDEKTGAVGRDVEQRRVGARQVEPNSGSMDFTCNDPPAVSRSASIRRFPIVRKKSRPPEPQRTAQPPA